MSRLGGVGGVRIHSKVQKTPNRTFGSPVRGSNQTRLNEASFGRRVSSRPDHNSQPAQIWVRCHIHPSGSLKWVLLRVFPKVTKPVGYSAASPGNSSNPKRAPDEQQNRAENSAINFKLPFRSCLCSFRIT